MSGQLRFEVLGPVRAWRGDAEVELGSPQQRAILGILLLRNGAVATSDQLVSAIWGETAPRAAVGMVRSYVSRLRRVLGDGSEETVIKSVAGGYGLPVEPGVLDVTDFERRVGVAREARHTGDLTTEADELRAALALWQGTPLAGVRGEYAEQERVRLFQLRLSAIEDLAAADLELGRHVEASAALVPVVIEQPLRERPRELLMLALYRSGRQAEALEVYQESQRLLADELGLDPGPELQEMQRRILRSDPALAGPLAVHQPPAPQLVEPPMQLPPDLSAFTGRAELVRRLSDALTPSDATVPVLGVTGLAGIGKTALAVHVGHVLMANFPDGQFFADLAWSAGPLPGLLRAIGVAGDAIPESDAERAALWRSLTADRRILLVLDDAQNLEQVLQVLPGPGGAAVIITARQRLFGLAHAQWTKLDGLIEDESLALLEHMIGADRVRAQLADARRLVHMTSGLPQVVHAAGDRLASRPGWSLATAVKRLGDRGGRLSHAESPLIEGPYESALAGLPPRQARALRLLAVPDGPDLSLPAAAAALDLPVAETEDLLESLADIHLVEPGTEERYRYLNPVRGFARARALLDDGLGECQAVLARVTRFYADTAANALLTLGLALPDTGPGGLTFADADSARRWLFAEHENLWASAAQTAGIPDAPTDRLTSLIGRPFQESLEELTH